MKIFTEINEGNEERAAELHSAVNNDLPEDFRIFPTWLFQFLPSAARQHVCVLRSLPLLLFKIRVP
jgi:hypothetical protein